MWLLYHNAKQAGYATVHCAVWSWEYIASGGAVIDCWMAANTSTGGPNTMCHSLPQFQKNRGGGGIPQSRFEPVISQTLKCYLHSTATCSMIWGMQTGWITGLTKRTPTQKLYVYYARAQTNKQTNKQTHTHSYICTNQDTIKNSTKSLRSVERIVNLVNNIFLYPNTIASASINRR